MIKIEDRLNIENRITRIEESYLSLHDDVKEIKRNLRWVLGIIFSLNSTIIGLLTQILHLN